MKCFMHPEEEAVGVCRTCGKAMCANCSAYSGHSGICPECRRNEFVQKREALNKEIVSLASRIEDTHRAYVWNIVGLVVTGITIIGLIYFGVKAHNRKEEEETLIAERSAKEASVRKLDAEIQKLNKALVHRGVAQI